MVAMLASGADDEEEAGICAGWFSLLQPTTNVAARTNGRIAKREITSIFSPSLAEILILRIHRQAYEHRRTESRGHRLQSYVVATRA